jgi:hypothetical protein
METAPLRRGFFMHRNAVHPARLWLILLIAAVRNLDVLTYGFLIQAETGGREGARRPAATRPKSCWLVPSNFRSHADMPWTRQPVRSAFVKSEFSRRAPLRSFSSGSMGSLKTRRRIAGPSVLSSIAIAFEGGRRGLRSWYSRSALCQAGGSRTTGRTSRPPHGRRGPGVWRRWCCSRGPPISVCRSLRRLVNL